ncbi:MAG: ATP-binding protein [Oscillospiraceae bacterium]|nr:ATP-binding protein [Oscillospiraceae bacterium]
MNIKRKIYAPMVMLSVLSCVAVLVCSVLLFSVELNNAMHDKNDVAKMVIEREIESLKANARNAAIGIASNQDLIEAVINNDRDRIMYIANALQIMARVEFCTILDNEGIVIIRTHAPDEYGQPLMLPHIEQALEGRVESYVAQGITVSLAAYGGAPIYNSNDEIIGVVSLGFRLDSQEFVRELKATTGCEVTFFSGDIRVSTSVTNGNNRFLLGSKADEEITNAVFAGEVFTGRIELFDKNVLAKYSPLYGENNEIIGMLCVGYYTAADTSKVVFFILTGSLITLIILGTTFVSARLLSTTIEQRLTKLNEDNNLQLAKLNLAVQATHIGLWDMEIIEHDPINPDNNFMWSDDFRNMLGYFTEEDFPNVLKSWSDRLHPDDKERVLDVFTKHILDKTGETPYYIEYRLLKNNDEYSYYRASGETIRDKKGNPLRVAGMLMDITEAKNSIIEIENQRAIAESANKAKTAFLANMSHEIRTPMNSIIGFSELAKDDKISDKTRQYLDNIHESAVVLLDIINDILDISKIESGKIELEKIPFDLPSIFAYCQMVIAPKTKERNTTLYCYAEPSVGKKMLGDPVRLRQIIINLLSNAVKFTNIGAIKLLASIKTSTEKTATIMFEVKDSGIGMTPEQIERIFEPFVQADGSVTRRFGGTGLGLAITKNIIELMGGELQVESAQGIGSRFAFELTFDLIDDTSKLPAQKILMNSFDKPNFTGEILVCEDNTLNQQVICDHLSRVGLQTVVTYNGEDGVKLVAERLRNGEKPFDLIFMDIHMPVMDGLEAATKIKEMGIETPIIAFTANVMSNDMELYKECGMADCIGKPFTTQELWQCLSRFIHISGFSAVGSNNNDDESLQKQVRLNFVRDNQHTFAELVKNLDAGDNKTAHRIVHTLKGNAGHLDEANLRKAAVEVEKSILDGENPIPKQSLNILELELKLVLEKLAPLLDEFNQNKVVETTDKEEIIRITQKLEPLLKAKNPECEDMLDEIRRIPGSGQLVKLIEEFSLKQAYSELQKIMMEWSQ